MSTQLSLDIITRTYASDIKFHNCFTFKNEIFMRVKPTGFLLNSSLIGDVINRGDIFVVNLSKGTVRAFQGDIEVQECDVQISGQVK